MKTHQLPVIVGATVDAQCSFMTSQERESNENKIHLPRQLMDESDGRNLIREASERPSIRRTLETFWDVGLQLSRRLVRSQTDGLSWMTAAAMLALHKTPPQFPQTSSFFINCFLQACWCSHILFINFILLHQTLYSPLPPQVHDS